MTKNKEEVISSQVNKKKDIQYTATARTRVTFSMGHCYIWHSMKVVGLHSLSFSAQKTRGRIVTTGRHQASKPSRRSAPSSQTVEGVAKTILWAPSSHSSASRPAKKNKCQSKGVRSRAGYAAESPLGAIASGELSKWRLVSHDSRGHRALDSEKRLRLRGGGEI